MIPECDVPNVVERIYDPDWLRFTTPYRDDIRSPRKCQRYAVKTHQGNRTRCVLSEFDGNRTELCHDGWVFENPENTIGTEVRSNRDSRPIKQAYLQTPHNRN